MSKESNGSENQTSDMERDNAPSRRRVGEQQVIWTIWMTYGAFYFCRTNLSVALPGIEEDLGYTKTQMAGVLLALKLAYAVGQFVNGQLSERFSPRLMLAIGMFTSAVLNVAFGFGTGLYFFIFVWACNGYFQSLGWTPCVRVIGNWIPVHRRGKAIGIVGTGYQLTAGLTFLVAGVGNLWFGWQGALFVPPVILISAAVLMVLLLRESPADQQSVETTKQIVVRQKGRFLTNLRLTLSNPMLWLLAVSLAMLNAVRYGFLDWGVSHLVAIEVEEFYEPVIKEKIESDATSESDKAALAKILAAGLSTPEGDKLRKQAIKDKILQEPAEADKRRTTLKSAVKYAVLPIGGIFGSLLAGWATDRFFRSRRAPVIFALLVLLGCMTLVYGPVAKSSFVATIVLLAGIGFCIYGPQVLLVGTAPADLAREGTSAAAAGFVNSTGYFGAALMGDLLTGHLVDNYGWQTAIFVWAGWAFGAAIVVAFLWNVAGGRGDSPQAKPVPANETKGG
ncbi:MAG: MFS transporter [Planctomycetes bacterium]|nr:MFS transporter [Planctomycetota bacterium]